MASVGRRPRSSITRALPVCDPVCALRQPTWAFKSCHGCAFHGRQFSVDFRRWPRSNDISVALLQQRRPEGAAAASTDAHARCRGTWAERGATCGAAASPSVRSSCSRTRCSQGVRLAAPHGRRTYCIAAIQSGCVLATPGTVNLRSTYSHITTGH